MFRKKIDRKFRIPRIWSNKELKKFAHLFKGNIVNVSGRNDEDKESSIYKLYFPNASNYFITNYEEQKESITKKSIYLDLESKTINKKLIGKFDVVFCHTVLEHTFDIFTSFKNLCLLSKDLIIIVVPYMQQIHGTGYYDYWRFTPYTIKRLFELNRFELLYCSSNGSDCSSIYLFCIGTKNKKKWLGKIPERFDIKMNEKQPLYANDYTNVIGGNVVKNSKSNWLLNLFK
jgi:hypothetical protein